MPADKPPIPSVWARPRARRAQPALSRERIVAEAVRLLDEEGMEALSMRGLAVRLGTAATSLYRHVANKDELIELVVDELYGELEVPDPVGATGWRAPLEHCAQSLRSVILRHPWVAPALGQVGLAELGPNLIDRSERRLALFHAAGFPPGEAEQAMNGLLAYVIGMSISEAAYLSVLARSGRTEQEWAECLRPAAERALDDHPRLREEFVARRDADPRVVRDTSFAYGLDRFLDGLQTRLAARESAKQSSTPQGST
ncbi:TetR/AcrR family transcriptional regulator C-terminal domain-containing protein [Actinomadura citrea]|uniref:TetR/AcrR family transcriptional regulator n=1 Tax=Actinomadura citrea TaxID=46158 RepID=UPI002E2A88EC|nr:TetR/AcrR family transcriptional regulator C-terminal domain-containing protein [Actinomadura citrea]